MEYYSAIKKKEVTSFVAVWMEVEIIILSKVRQRRQISYHFYWASLVVLMVKSLTAMQETWVQPLGWEDPLEKGMATLSSILA